MPDEPVLTITHVLTPDLRAAIAKALGQETAGDTECRSFCIGLLSGAVNDMIAGRTRLPDPSDRERRGLRMIRTGNVMDRRNVSTVCRGPGGFLEAYRDASGDPERLPPWWHARRAAFIARMHGQALLRGEPPRDARGRLTRRSLALLRGRLIRRDMERGDAAPADPQRIAMTTLRPSRLRLSTETLRFLTVATADASRGRPCHTHYSCDGLPCNRSEETCP